MEVHTEPLKSTELSPQVILFIIKTLITTYMPLRSKFKL